MVMKGCTGGAYVTNEPWYLIQKGLEPVILSPRMYGVDFYSDCLFAIEEETINHPERVRAFLKTSLQGWEYAMSHTEEMIDLMRAHYGVKKNRDHLRYEADSIRKLMMPDLVQVGHQNPGRWRHIAQTYAKLGMIEGDFQLEGFLYDSDARPDTTWILHTAAVVGAISLMVCIGAAILLFFNRRMSAEIKLRKLIEEELRASEEKLRNIVENSTNMFYSHTADHRLTYISPQCREFLQCEPEEAMIRWTEFATDNPINVKGVERTEEAIRTGIRQPSYELELVGKKGKRIYVEVRENPVVVEGNTVAIVGSLTDITDRETAEREKRELRSQLIQAHKMEAVGTLAGGIAHDFNNILGIVLGNAELASLDIPMWNQARVCINEIKTASLRAKEVVRQLLSFSRKTEQERRPLNIEPVIAESVQLLRASMPSSIDIQFHVEGPIEPIMADPTQIQQVAINLCTNAAQAMEPDGGNLTIRLGTMDGSSISPAPSRAGRNGKAVYLTVEDTGNGIDPAIRDRIFDPYFTTKEVGKGTGMGLSIVHGIVRNHDGAISVSSVPGRGTAITARFPVCDGLPEEETSAANFLPSGSESILLVDDEVALMAMLEKLLGHLGYTVEASQNPEQALKLFAAAPNRFDLIITDMTMPKMNGLELVKASRMIRSEIPVIVCTGRSDQIDSQSAKEHGINGLAMKPVTTAEMAEIVRSVLDEANTVGQKVERRS